VDMGTIEASVVASCEDEDLRHSGYVLSHGALLHVAAQSGLVTHVGENIGDFVPLTPAQILGRPFADCAIPVALHPDDLRRAPGSRTEESVDAGRAGVRLRVLVTVTQSGWLVELLAGSTARVAAARPGRHQQAQFESVSNDEDIVSFATALTELARELGGFGRAMVYRFEDDWAGTVIAESVAPGIEGFVGLRFPASDIPKIARDLYLLTPYRHIPDSLAQPVRLLSAGGEPLDLTYADLRSVSPMHIEYMRNMGVAASFSVPIVVQSSLWGLLASHRLSGSQLGQDDISHIRELVHSYEIGLANYFASRRVAALGRIERTVEAIRSDVAGPQDVFSAALKHGSALSAMIDCGAGALVHRGRTLAFGRNPPDVAVIDAIDRWFVQRQGEPLLITDHLCSLLPQAQAFAQQVSGLVAMKINEARFYWYRPELIQQVDWAGNPFKPGALPGDMSQLSPRRSFQKWAETKNLQSDSWRNEHRMAAKKISKLLMEWPWPWLR
jgi:chemotaxis family two-component system sensor kinase Cph1